MLTTARSRTVLGVGVVCALGLAAWAKCAGTSRTAAQPRKEGQYLGASSCMECHTSGPSGARDQDFVLLTEYATWRTQDQHSLAYFALVGPRGQQMARALKLDVTKPEAGCLSCHAMGFVQKEQQGDTFDSRDGVSCDACHGPAKEWFELHSSPRERRNWRQMSAADKTEKGMRDLRDPATRTRLCMSCHVGDASEGKVVTHAMFAAGHPPLPNIEIALWSHNLPQHYRDKKDVPALRNPAGVGIKLDKARIDDVYHMAAAEYQQTQLVAGSSLAGLRCAMLFVAGRSDLQLGDRDQRWPELRMPFEDFRNREPAAVWPQLAMAQSDCYACHHELQRPGWRQRRGYVGPPGRPQLPAWPAALVKQGVGLEKGSTGLSNELTRLVEACNLRPFGDPEKIVRAALAVQTWAERQPDFSRLQDQTYDRLRLLKQLCTLGPNELPDYDSARQIAAAIDVIYREGGAQFSPDKQAALKPIVEALRKEFSLRPDPQCKRDRINLITGQFSAMNRGRKYLQTPGAVEALERASAHGLDELKQKEKKPVFDELETFLVELARTDGRKFTDYMLKSDEQNTRDLLANLHKINDTELSQSMRKVRDYNPFTFKQQLATLLKLLS